jgi:hypothetical protein
MLTPDSFFFELDNHEIEVVMQECAAAHGVRCPSYGRVANIAKAENPENPGL